MKKYGNLQLGDILFIILELALIIILGELGVWDEL